MSFEVHLYRLQDSVFLMWGYTVRVWHGDTWRTGGESWSGVAFGKYMAKRRAERSIDRYKNSRSPAEESYWI